MELKKGILLFAIIQTLVFTTFNIYQYMLEQNAINSTFMGLGFACLVALGLAYQHINHKVMDNFKGSYL